MTTHKWLATILITPLALPASATSCANHGDSPGEPAVEAQAHDEVPADWLGYELGIAPPTIVEVDFPPVVSPSDLGEEVASESTHLPTDSEIAAATSPDDDDSWTLHRLDTGRAYRVEFEPAALAALYGAMVERGDTSGFRPDRTPEQGDAVELPKRRALDPPPEMDLPEGAAANWSDGIDNRIRRGIADGYGVGYWPYRAIGHFINGEGCTGTLIGRRTVLTAAHCVARQGIGPVSNNPFRARSDNTENPAQLEPYGTANIVSTWTPSSYTDPAKCLPNTTANQIACNKWDIAVVELDQNVGNQTGGIGYGYAGDSTIASWSFYMRGYPSCSTSFSSRPSDCPPQSSGTPFRNAALWGSGSCTVDDFWSMGPKGWNREMSASCDGSPGMSGSALYTYESSVNPGGPVAFGVYSQALCSAGGCTGNSHPSDITRITPTFASMIAARKSLWGG